MILLNVYRSGYDEDSDFLKCKSEIINWKKLAGCFEFLQVIIFNIYPFELVSFSWQRKGILLDNE
jgi:hypothetical protein